jgi:hypothetical protein
MWRGVERFGWITLLLVAICLSLTACSMQQQDLRDDLAVNTTDPFDDPFFTQPPAWDDSVLEQSEILAEQSEEPEKPQTFLEKSEGIVMSTLIVGASLAKMALPFMGF